ncbi:MAG: tRNA-dihydrouridine synthase [Clostridiales bacterium]|nr:tRNA-dihydrouridine synthase [Clostridiales bacterium]
MFKIGNVKIPNRCLLAPMAGYGDRAFRQMCREGGAGLSTTEMISCKGLLHNNIQTQSMLKVSQCEVPVAVQLFGKEPNDFERAVEDNRLAHFDIIDINMGCPVNKVIKHGEGSELMATPKLACEIVRACKKSSSGRPITVKTRLGIECGKSTVLNFVLALQEAGVSSVTIHGRYQQQLYRGQADWEAISHVAEHVSIPVIGSGDVSSAEEYQRYLRYPNIAAVSIARGALGNPNIFNSILHHSQIESNPRHVMSLCKRHFELCIQYTPNLAVSVFKKHFACYIANLKKLSRFKNQILNEYKQQAHKLDSVQGTFDLIGILSDAVMEI